MESTFSKNRVHKEGEKGESNRHHSSHSKSQTQKTQHRASLVRDSESKRAQTVPKREHKSLTLCDITRSLSLAPSPSFLQSLSSLGTLSLQKQKEQLTANSTNKTQTQTQTLQHIASHAMEITFKSKRGYKTIRRLYIPPGGVGPLVAIYNT